MKIIRCIVLFYRILYTLLKNKIEEYMNRYYTGWLLYFLVFCKMDLPLDKIHYTLCEVQFDIRSKKMYATHCNSGCITCGTFLPSWWPMLSHTMHFPSYISDTELELWMNKTSKYIIDGCCSFDCYKSTPGRVCTNGIQLKEGKRVDLYCTAPYCDEYIHPVDAAVFHTKFCSHSCMEEARHERYEHYRDIMCHKRRR